MARLLPDELDTPKSRGQAAREIETLERLEREFPDEFTVFHGVHWAHSDQRAAFYGEIDFVVVNRQGRAIAIEQKRSGSFHPSGEGWSRTLPADPAGAESLRRILVRWSGSTLSSRLKASSLSSFHCEAPVAAQRERVPPSQVSWRAAKASIKPSGRKSGGANLFRSPPVCPDCQ